MINSKNILFGTSFSPELTEEIYQQDPIHILKVIHRDLDITDIRFGLRWNKIEQNKQLSLSYYDKYIEYLLKNKVKLCLNVGPIKTFRWPEEHIPQYLVSKVEKNISPDSELAKYANEYLHKLLTILKKTYPEIGDSTSLQIENEGYNRFGHFKMRMTDEYLLEQIAVLKEYFPANKLMINSAGRQDLKKVIALFKSLTDQNVYKGNDLILGFNYYFKIPDVLKYVPFMNAVDPIKFSFPFNMGIKRLHKYQKDMQFDMEISEGQFEPWHTETSPGNIYDDLEYLVEKCYRYFPEDFDKKLIRLWGTEKLAVRMKEKTVSEEHSKMVNRIKRIA